MEMISRWINLLVCVTKFLNSCTMPVELVSKVILFTAQLLCSHLEFAIQALLSSHSFMSTVSKETETATMVATIEAAVVLTMLGTMAIVVIATIKETTVELVSLCLSHCWHFWLCYDITHVILISDRCCCIGHVWLCMAFGVLGASLSGWRCGLVGWQGQTWYSMHSLGLTQCLTGSVTKYPRPVT